MAAFIGTKYVRGVASGTDALRLGARAAGVRPGRRGPHPGQRVRGGRRGAASTVGARPVPVDIRRDDLGPDPEHLAALVGPRTRAILVVHLYGFPVDMDPISRSRASAAWS